MLDLLKKDLEDEGQGNIFVENTACSLLLKATKADQQHYPMERHYQWLREKGEALANGENTHLATIINIDGNHWVAVIIDSQDKQIHFGDSFGHTIPNNLKQVFNWWLGYHMNATNFFLPNATGVKTVRYILLWSFVLGWPSFISAEKKTKTY